MPEGDHVNPRPIDPGVDIGHVHLKVAELERSLDFYCGVLGFELMQPLDLEALLEDAVEADPGARV